jgi:two-component system NtrC family response regulator
MPTAPRILLIDDDKNLRAVLAFALKEKGFSVATAAEGAEGLDRIAADPPDVILCDLKMPGMDGLAFLKALRDRGDNTSVLVITAFGSIESAVEAMRAGADDYVTKPINRDVLQFSIERALRHRRLLDENRRLREQVGGERAVERLLGVSTAVAALRETILRLAESDATVLLLGESGVGKELAARALHFDGPRADAGRFVVLNCSAIPGELLESELFGHRKGAFTGATADHTGKFEAADKGTLFLDEIGDMPLPLQAKLLRALQEGEIERVGDNRPRKVDVRVVAATNQPLEQRIAEGAFRKDLYYRLAVVPVKLPPLRSRLDDLPILIRHFLARYGAPGADAAPDVLERLQSHSWPGNIREPLALVAPPDSSTAISVAAFIEGPIELPPDGVDFDAVERRLLEAAWEQSAHNQSAGARLLGLPRQAFIYRLQKHGILAPYGEQGKENTS